MELHSKETNALLALLSYELFDRGLDGSFEDVDFFKVIAFANRHAVTPLLYSGIGKIEGLGQAAFDEVERHAVRSTILTDRMAKIQKSILDGFREKNIACAILKGMSIAAYYRHPEVRMTGDIDILVARKDLEACGRVLKNAGFTFEGKSELHEVYRQGRVVVEVHEEVSRFPENEKGEYARRLLKSGLKDTDTQTIGQNSFPVLRKPVQMVSVLAHMERHMGANGIGLRQLCDWAVAVNAVKENEKDAVLREIENCGLLQFACVLTGACRKYLGLTGSKWLKDADEKLVDEAMADILSVGNFQEQMKVRPLASAMIDPYDVDGEGRRRIFKTYFRRVERKMRVNHPWAKSRAWAVPFGAYYAACYAIKVLTGKGNAKGVLNAFKTAKDREKLLRKMCLYK